MAYTLTQFAETHDLSSERDALIQDWSQRFAGAEPEEILSFALGTEFPGTIALVSSFGAEAAVLLHMVAAINKSAPVLFLETGKHFAQTLSYRKRLIAQLGLTNAEEIKPAATSLNVQDPNGDLWKQDSAACCDIRKVKPLETALSRYNGWITGRKQFHGGERIRLPIFERTQAHIKVNPLVSWTPERIEDYLSSHELPRHPLIEQGFPSIGCWPCTHPVATGDDVRSGRWRGQSKTECGIHRTK